MGLDKVLGEKKISRPVFEDHARHVDQLVRASLGAADPAAAVARYLDNPARQQDLFASVKHIFLVGVGKAAFTMGAAAVKTLGDRIVEGVLIAKSPGDGAEDRNDDPAVTALPEQIRPFVAGHPLSDERSVRATAAAIDMLEKTRPGDLVLCLISGGASALFTQPRLPLERWQHLVDALLASGCTINELNAVRKQLDRVKGGGLARLAAPAACVSLILSDVVGNPLDVIGSGPTVANPDPPSRARQVLARYGIDRRLGAEVWTSVEEQLDIIEGEGRPAAIDAGNVIIGDVRLAAQAAVDAASALGFQAALLTAHLEGEAREVGRVAAALAKDLQPGSCLVLGGETTVTLRGDGFGGRNLELALSAAINLDGWDNVALATLATDGDDGPTDAAGAVITGFTAVRARSLALDPVDYLDRNDSYRFFEKTGGLLLTGPTGTNVNDLVYILRY